MVNGLKYPTKKWENYSICITTNCYAYALNLTKNPITNKIFTDMIDVQPGNICGRNEKNYAYIDKAINKHNKEGIERFIKLFREDCKFLNYEVRKSSLKETRKGKWWKVVCYFEKGDYHWYRQDSNGSWSHKLGHQKIKNVDKSDKVITNPETCNRGDYNLLIGYFLIRKKIK